MIGKLRRLAKAKTGVAAVEFGMVFPIFLLMMMGTLEFGNYLNQLAMLENAVRAGGMYASRTDAVVDDVGDLNTTAIQNIVMTGDPTNSTDFILQGWSNSYSDPTNDVCATPSQKLCIQVVSRTGTEGTTTENILSKQFNTTTIRSTENAFAPIAFKG